MPGDIFGGLSHVHDGSAQLRRITDQPGPRLGPAGGTPGRHPAGKLADQLLVADLEALLDELAAILPLIEDEDERPVGGHEPAEPRRERATQCDR